MSETGNETGLIRDAGVPVCEDVCDNEPRIGLVGLPAGPDAPACKCGQGRHPRHPQVCAKGHALPKNTRALASGQCSAAFWRAHDAARSEIASAIVADAGHSRDDAPRALTLAADAIAQATLVQQSAFLRMVESGGPLTTADRARRAFMVWLAATDRLERFVRLVGLKRQARDLGDSPLDWIRRQDSRQSGDSVEPQAAGATNDDQAVV
jgi:hypothetical protein